MKEKQTLRKKIDAFVGGCRSGIVAVCGNPSIENGLDYVVYFHSLRTIHVVHTDIWSEYFYAGATNCVTRVLEEFSGRDDMLDIVDLGIDESAFLTKDLSSLLWDMTHDDDFAYSDEEFEWLANAGLEDPYPLSISPEFHTFTIFGDVELESDINHFHGLLLSSEHFIVAGSEFCVETSLDENTGEPIYLLKHGTPILCDDEWQTLYAKTRTFIFLNYVHKRKTD